MARGDALIRQWNLLKTLQAHRFGISAVEVAERLMCSKRQVQRDLKVLMTSGFPIEFDERDFGKRFWKLSPRFLERQGLILSVTEVLSLFIGRQLLAPLVGTEFGDGLASALEKAKSLLPYKALDYFDNLDETLMVKNVARPDYSGLDNEIRILNQAMTEKREVTIDYFSASRGCHIEDRFRPYGMVLLGMNLYCVGLLVEHESVRTLKVDRIRGLSLEGARFRRPRGFSLQDYIDGSFGVFSSGEPQHVEVSFTGWAATNVREQSWHSTQEIIEDTGDSLRASFDLCDTTEFKRWLLGFGRHAVVLKPDGFVRDIACELTEALRAYHPGIKGCGEG